MMSDYVVEEFRGFGRGALDELEGLMGALELHQHVEAPGTMSRVWLGNCSLILSWARLSGIK